MRKEGGCGKGGNGGDVKKMGSSKGRRKRVVEETGCCEVDWVAGGKETTEEYEYEVREARGLWAR